MTDHEAILAVAGENAIYTEYSNAQKLVARYGAKVRYCPQWGTFLLYDGKRWRKDDTGAMSRCLTPIASVSNRRSLSNT